MAKTVHIVDDSPSVLQYLRHLLEKDGYDVRLYSDGLQAVPAFRETLPDIVILDVNMPEIDGYTICRHMKADNRLQDIPVIFLSGSNDIRSKVLAFEAGGLDYITKPFYDEEILVRVRSHIDYDSIKRNLDTKVRELESTLQALEQTQDALIDTRAKSTIDVLVGGIAHELSTPVGILLTASTLVQEQLRSALANSNSIHADDFTTIIESIQLMHNNTEFLAQLVNTVKQISSEEFSVHSEVGGIRGLIHTIVESAVPTTDRRPVIHISCDEDIIARHPVQAMMMIFSKLIENSLDHGSSVEGLPGGIHIGLQADGRDMVITYADEGVGIDRESLSFVFDPFFTSKRGVRKHMGMGLFVVKNIVGGLLDGRITLNPDKTPGVEFRITYPLVL